MSAHLAVLPFAPFARPQRVALTDIDAIAQAESRYRLILPLLEYHPDAPGCRMLRLQDGTPVTSFSRMVEYVSEQSKITSQGVSTATLYKYLANFRNGGRPALADLQRKDKGTSRFFDSYPKAKWMAAYIFLDERMSVRVAYEFILGNLQLLEIPRENAPSYETVRAWLKQLPAALTIYARQGRKAYRDLISPYLKRMYTDIYANQAWVVDHMIHDIFALNNVFDDFEPWQRIRIRLTSLIDYRSRASLGVSWAVEGSSNSLAAACTRAIQLYGPPELWYLDNGKDMQKVARGAESGFQTDRQRLRDEFSWIESTGFLARTGIGATFCLPFHPQSKHIERYHRTLHERYDKVWSEAYTGPDPFHRPDPATLAMMEHSKLLKAGHGSESNLPLASTVIAGALGWMEEYNNSPHTGEGMDGATPMEVFNANRNPNQRPTPEPAALALLMKNREVRKVRECVVTRRNHRYEPCNLDDWKTLHNYATNEPNGRDLLIAFDEGLPETIDALDLDGNFLCRLQAETLMRFAPGDPTTQAQIAESFRIRRGLEKATRETLTVISRVARSNGAVSPLEAMSSRLQFNAGETGIGVVTQRAPRSTKPTTEPINKLIPGQAADRLAARLRRNSADPSKS